jgi:hypothetical protein
VSSDNIISLEVGERTFTLNIIYSKDLVQTYFYNIGKNFNLVNGLTIIFILGCKFNIFNQMRNHINTGKK